MKKAPLYFPIHEPEVIAAGARCYAGDDEKVATTSIKYAVVHEVSLSSRYDKAGEYQAMAAMVEGVSTNLRCFIESVWCDSKANACYSVFLRPCSLAKAKQIAHQMETACISYGGGHNGIYFHGANAGTLDLDPYWLGADEELGN